MSEKKSGGGVLTHTVDRCLSPVVCVYSCIDVKTVNAELLINVTCVSPADKQRSKLTVWITWRLPPAADDTHQWHSFIEVVNDRPSHLHYIAETDTDHKRLDLPANQLFDIRVCD